MHNLLHVGLLNAEQATFKTAYKDKVKHPNTGGYGEAGVESVEL